MTKKRAGLPEVAKYIVLAVMLIYVVVLMLFTSGSNKSFEEVSETVSASIDTENLTEMSERMLKRNFGLNSADYDGVMYYASESSMSVEEVLLIKVKSRGQIQEVTDALDERTQARIAAFEGYGSEEVRLLEDAQQSVRGRFIFFAVSSQAGEYRSVFDSSL